MSFPRSANGLIWFGCVFLLATPAGWAAGLQAPAPPDVEVTLHEPAFAELTFSNMSEAAVVIDMGQASEDHYELTIIRPNGSVVRAGKPYWATIPDTIAGIEWKRIEPGRSAKRSLLLNQWFPFDEVGRYSVALNVPGVEGTIRFWVGVSPRDESRLRAICERLTEDAIPPGSPNGIEAARTLGFVIDDLAIPYLAKVASSPAAVTGLAFDGLMRIDDEQSVSTLTSLLRDSNQDTRRQARGTLGLMLIKSGNVQVRRAATSALNAPSH
jgi:hypothetical protein